MKAELIDVMGDDLRVVNAARVSFDKRKEVFDEKDEKLIHYLAKHNHFTPFTHPQITLRETVPIFVARQRFKHTVGLTYNEVSRRYVDDDPVIYTPETWRSRPDGSVKQGSGDSIVETISQYGQEYSIHAAYADLMCRAEGLYTSMIEAGVAPEQARMVLPQSMFTSYYVTGSLAAFANSYRLRIDSQAQKEIQELAAQWDKILRPIFPVSWEALTK